ncbi:hypothetical protein ABIB89_003229 [Bradyrhizobium sp. JR3.12]
MVSVRLFKNLDCADCIKKGKQAERGCETEFILGGEPYLYWTDIDGLPRGRCPRRPIFENLDWFNQIITAYNSYKNGFLPHAGGVANQPALFPFVMTAIDTTMSACDKAEDERGKESGEGVSVLGKKPRSSG